MRLLKQALGVLGALVVVAVMVALVSPKKARAMVVSMVKIVPGTTTQVGQNESQLVSLSCVISNSFCNAVDPEGNVSANGYVVPSGYTLVVTDWEFLVFGGSDAAGTFVRDDLQNGNSGKTNMVEAFALADNLGNAYGHEHYAAGIRVGSGVTIQDLFTATSSGSAQVQGYLVPND